MAAPAPCPTCIFGATASSTLSFTYHAIQTITVSVIPHVTVYSNGTDKTSFESITESRTAYVGSGGNSSAPKTFTNKNDITWTVGDATLTYPTTYIQYLGFEGALITSSSGDACEAPTEIPAVDLPSSTDCASFIFPLDVDATGAMPLPTPLLDYLAQLPEVSAQFNGEPLTGCAPLTWTGPASAIASTSGGAATYGSASEASSPVSTYSSIPALQSTSSRPGNYSGSLTTRIRPGPPSTRSSTTIATSITSAPTSGVDHSPTITGPHGGPETISTLPYGGGSSELGASSAVPSPPHYSTGTTTAQASLTHTTAFVIEPITGPTTYTTIGSPNHDHTKNPDGYGTTKHGDEPQHTGSNGHSPGQQPQKSPQVSPAGTEKGSHHTHKQPQVYTHGHKTITANHHGGVVVGSETVRPGHKATIGSGSHTTVVAVETKHGKTKVVVGGSTYKQHAAHTPGHRQVSVGVVTAGEHTFTAMDAGKTIVLKDGSTTMSLKNGAHTTFEGHSISVASKGTAVIVDGKTTTLSAVGGKMTSGSAVVTAGGHTITALDKSGSVILHDATSTTIVSDGKMATFDGQKISVPPHGSAVVVNGKTVSFSSSPTTTGVGGYVKAGLGGTQTSSTLTSSHPAASVNTGATSSLRHRGSVAIVGSVLLGCLGVAAIL